MALSPPACLRLAPPSLPRAPGSTHPHPRAASHAPTPVPPPPLPLAPTPPSTPPHRTPSHQQHPSSKQQAAAAHLASSALHPPTPGGQGDEDARALAPTCVMLRALPRRGKTGGDRWQPAHIDRTPPSLLHAAWRSAEPPIAHLPPPPLPPACTSRPPSRAALVAPPPLVLRQHQAVSQPWPPPQQPQSGRRRRRHPRPSQKSFKRLWTLSPRCQVGARGVGGTRGGRGGARRRCGYTGRAIAGDPRAPPAPTDSRLTEESKLLLYALHEQATKV